MAWMALIGTAGFFAIVWRWGADTRDGRDWQPSRSGQAIGHDRRS